MGDKSSIQWTDATWNPVTGCSKVSQGCKNCYAERIWPRVYGKFRPFSDVKLHGDRLDLPHTWRKPRRVFVNSMSDLFHESLSDNDITKVWSVMVVADRHTYQVLTKRPERMRDYVAGWINHMRAESKRPIENVWLGVSVEDQKTAEERIPILLQTPAALRWISYEPALGPLDLRRASPLTKFLTGAFGGIDWVICGGESGPKARPFDPDWARYIRDQCKEASVPFFMKQFGSYPVLDPRYIMPGGTRRLRDGHGGDPEEWPEDLRIREYPKVKEDIQPCPKKKE